MLPRVTDQLLRNVIIGYHKQTFGLSTHIGIMTRRR